MTLPADIHPIRLSLIETDLAAAAAGFGDAFARTGFAVVSDHGIDQALIDRANAATKAFFALPEEVKRAYVVPGGGGQRGLTPFGIEAAKGEAKADLKEFWHVGRDLPPGHPYAAQMPPNLWPGEIADFRSAVSALYAALDHAGGRMLRAIAVHLGLAADFFEDPVRDGNSVLRLLHYPPVAPETAGAIRAGAHEDINVITLLLGAEEAGLQLLGTDGQWRVVPAPPGSLVCNIGDMLQRMTGHRLPSTTHRVVNPAPERMGVARYSTPFFLHFRPDYLIESLPGGPRS
ncbi:2-oxoglutarate and iron-dependent oxygenase domain-containing protein, partial [Sandarakinorhabdus sp.]|uniref:isopenicillin N synthase family dioxygenase n=1 Tax=Sandarakinorhabdus sp. TaxID=1916663 RepID=UPI0033402371